MVFLELIYNLALLIALSTVSNSIVKRRKSRYSGVLQGLLFGTVAVLGMLHPLNLQPGIIIDGRSVVISTCALFFGTAATVVSSVAAITCRLLIGGIGTRTGILFVLFSGALGLLFHHLWIRKKTAITPFKLWAFGLLVNTTTLFLFVTLPPEAVLPTIKAVSVPILLLFPFANLLVGKILVDHAAHAQFVKKLQARREEFRTTFYSIGDAVIVTDRELRVQQMNSKAEELTGWIESEARMQPLEQVARLVDEETRKPIDSPAREALDKNKSVQLASSALLLARTGIEYPIADSAAPIRHSAGNVSGVVLVFRDQTQERAARRALEINEERFQTLFDKAPLSYQSLDENGCLLEVNQTWLDTLGYTRKEVIGKWFGDFLSPETVFIFEEHFPDFKQKGKVETELEVRHKDGSIRNILLNGRVGYHHDGTFRQTHCIFADITESRRSESKRRTAERKLQTLMGNLPGMAYRCRNDADWTMEFVSEGCRELTGFLPEQLTENKKLSYQDLIHPDDRENIRQTIRSATAQSAPFQLEYRIRTATGEEKWVWEKGCISPNNEEETEVLEGFIMDISDLKRAKQDQEKLEEELHRSHKLEAVGRLAGGIAHDFNNMLQVILGRTEMLMESMGDNAVGMQSLKEIQKTARRSAELTRQLLIFARKQNVILETFSLNEAVTASLGTLHHLLTDKVDLHWLPSKSDSFITMDRSQFKQILSNLTINAQDAILGHGDITIETGQMTVDSKYCRKHPEAAPGDYAKITFRDTGCGMDKETCEHIFEPFYTTKCIASGSGLGLATMYGIIRQNNGFITIDSHKGKGTAFDIFLPLQQQTAAQESSSSATAPPLGRETILLVEDNTPLLDLSQLQLEELGYTVLATDDPEEALRMAGSYDGQIDLLLTDVIMPKMTGIELATHLSQLRPEIKAVFMSGYTASVISQHGFLKTQAAFLQKPFSQEDMALKIRETLAS